jgi:hypothetical protein
MLIWLCKKFLEYSFLNPWEPKLITESERILKELDKDPLPYQIFNLKKHNVWLTLGFRSHAFNFTNLGKKRRRKIKRTKLRHKIFSNPKMSSMMKKK